jgi:hypothetical protein
MRIWGWVRASSRNMWCVCGGWSQFLEQQRHRSDEEMKGRAIDEDPGRKRRAPEQSLFSAPA